MSDSLVSVVLAALLQAAQQFPGVEAGGAVYQCEGGPPVALAPASTGSRGSLDLRLPKRLKGCPMVALYHTHPQGKLEFSSHDIAMACQLRLPSFMLPEGDAPRLFDCGTTRADIMVADARKSPKLARGKRLDVFRL